MTDQEEQSLRETKRKEKRIEEETEGLAREQGRKKAYMAREQARKKDYLAREKATAEAQDVRKRKAKKQSQE
jgi:hypothetical protein